MVWEIGPSYRHLEEVNVCFTFPKDLVAECIQILK